MSNRFFNVSNFIQFFNTNWCIHCKQGQLKLLQNLVCKIGRVNLETISMKGHIGHKTEIKINKKMGFSSNSLHIVT